MAGGPFRGRCLTGEMQSWVHRVAWELLRNSCRRASERVPLRLILRPAGSVLLEVSFNTICQSSGQPFPVLVGGQASSILLTGDEPQLDEYRGDLEGLEDHEPGLLDPSRGGQLPVRESVENLLGGAAAPEKGIRLAEVHQEWDILEPGILLHDVVGIGHVLQPGQLAGCLIGRRSYGEEEDLGAMSRAAARSVDVDADEEISPFRLGLPHPLTQRDADIPVPGQDSADTASPIQDLGQPTSDIQHDILLLQPACNRPRIIAPVARVDDHNAGASPAGQRINMQRTIIRRDRSEFGGKQVDHKPLRTAIARLQPEDPGGAPIRVTDAGQGSPVLIDQRQSQKQTLGVWRLQASSETDSREFDQKHARLGGICSVGETDITQIEHKPGLCGGHAKTNRIHEYGPRSRACGKEETEQGRKKPGPGLTKVSWHE